MDKSVQSIMDSFRRITRAIRNHSRSAEEDIGLRSAQLFVLQQIKKFEPLSMNELAEHTYSHQSTVSVVVSGLVKKGYVLNVPSEEDKRRVVLKMTKKGSSLLKKKRKTIQEQFAGAINSMSSQERQKLASLLELFIINAGLVNETPHFFFEKEGPAHLKRPSRSSK